MINFEKRRDSVVLIVKKGQPSLRRVLSLKEMMELSEELTYIYKKRDFTPRASNFGREADTI